MMRCADGSPLRSWCQLVSLALAMPFAAATAAAAGPAIETKLSPQTLDALVRIHAEATPGARTGAYLGSEREGSGAVIDADGLVVTIGYLVTEAMAIDVTAGDGKTVPASLVGLDP
jgi:serine protease Do